MAAHRSKSGPLMSAIMGKFPVHDGLRWIGWMTTAVMAVAAIVMGVTVIF